MAITRRGFVGTAGALAAGAVLGRVTALRAQDRPALPIPPELKPDADGHLALSAQTGTRTFVAAGPTDTMGFNGDYLGPTLRLRRGSTARMEVTNALDQKITVHWHGLIIPGEQDGGPHQIIQPGGTWRPHLDVDQPAATLWYHPHVYPTTAELVIHGLAGMLIVDDDETDALPLPSTWGVDDIPVVIQDRRFDANGAFFHCFNLAAVTVGYVGDTVLVNGAIDPVARTARGWLRLRILNGSNARSYRLRASDGRQLMVIGTDGGLLEAPVASTELVLHAGERYEVMVDARDGKRFDVVALPLEGQPVMHLPPFDKPLRILTLDPAGADGKGQLPDALATLPSLPQTLPEVSQTLSMTMSLDDQGMAELMRAGLGKVMTAGGPAPAVVSSLDTVVVDENALPLGKRLAANGINGMPYSLEMKPFDVPQGEFVRWRFGEGSDKMVHPIHVHGCQFRILSELGKPPVPERAGWKDIVTLANAQAAEILVRFPKKAGPDSPYVAHCHILEHEDSGMMTQFSVT